MCFIINCFISLGVMAESYIYIYIMGVVKPKKTICKMHKYLNIGTQVLIWKNQYGKNHDE